MRRDSASILTHKKVIYSSSGSLPIVRMAYDTEALILFIATVLPLGVWLATNGDLSGGSFLHFLQTHDSRWTAARVRDALDPPHPRRAARARQDEVKSTTQATASTLRAPPLQAEELQLGVADPRATAGTKTGPPAAAFLARSSR